MKVSEGGGGGIAAVAARQQAETRLKIEARAGRATNGERAEAERILAKAKAATTFEAESGVIMTSGLAALLFVNSPMHNRDWHAAKSLGFVAAISRGEWRTHGVLTQFYLGGDFADSQHRLGGIALSEDFSAPCAMAYGLELDAILAMDVGTKRTAADATKLGGMQNAKVKEAVIKSAAGYLKKVKDGIVIPTTSNFQIADALKHYDVLLTTALTVAEQGHKGIAQPILTDKQSATLAFLLLMHDWPVEDVQQKLYRLQTGNVPEGGSDKDPLFLAGELIVNTREKAKGREIVRSQNEIAIAIKALILAENGVAATKTADLRNAVKAMPDPDYPLRTREAA